MISFLILIAGFVLLIIGANKLVEGASSLASKLGIPDIVIGLTVVAFGTSAPELVVNLVAALEGNSDMVLGNVLGSNIFNVLCILGISSMVYPLTVKKDTTWLEIPMSLLAAVALFFLVSDVRFDGADFDFLSRTDGIILLLFFSIFLVYNIKVSQNGTADEDSGRVELTILKSIIFLLIGFAGLVIGGMVTSGRLVKGAKVRVIRDERIAFDGKLETLRRFKDDVSEVTEGLECGVGIENFQDLREHDILECYQMESVAATL